MSLTETAGTGTLTTSHSRRSTAWVSAAEPLEHERGGLGGQVESKIAAPLRARPLWGGRLLGALVVCGLAFPPPIEAQCVLNEDARIESYEKADLDFYGAAVAIDGSVMVVCAYGADGAARNAGAAYVYRRQADAWQFEQKIFSPGASRNDALGSAVAVCGDVIAIGTESYTKGGVVFRGAAHIFRHDGAQWVEEASFFGTEVFERLGSNVAVGTDCVAISSPGRSHAGEERHGVVEIYRRSGQSWVLSETLMASDSGEYHSFGDGLAIDGDAMAVGAPGAPVGGDDRGAAYVFRESGGSWTEETKLMASDGEDSDRLGVSCDISGDVVVVGTTDKDATVGAAYVFRHSGGGAWAEEQTLQGHDTEAGDEFARGVAVSGDLVAVFSYFDDEAATRAGSVFLFRCVGPRWVEQAEFVGSDTEGNDSFGFGLALEGDELVAGAPGIGNEAGAVYTLTCPPLAIDMQPNTLVANDPFELWVGGGVPNGVFAVFTLDLSGTPFVFKLLLSTFDADGLFHLPSTMPDLPDLVGHTLTLQALSIGRDGSVVASNGEVLTFQ